MSIKLLSQTDTKLKFEVEIDIKGSMLAVEEKILNTLNEVGCVATREKLKLFDTDGSPIVVGQTKFTSRCKNNEMYQTPYGAVDVERHVYQTSAGGKIYCPLEVAARIINTSTPRFAKILSNKYARLSAPEAKKDLEENHGRPISIAYLQKVSEAISAIAELKEETWEYSVPALDMSIKSIAISLDGAFVLMHKEGYREAMVGSLSLYDAKGDRQYTIYLGARPEYGKAEFKARLEREIKRIKELYPTAEYIGIADGAKNNWDFLKRHTDGQLIDFYHVTEYLSDAAQAAYPLKSDQAERAIWLEERCHRLKHDKGAALEILAEIKMLKRRKLRKEIKDNLEAAITYLENNHLMMQYHSHVKKRFPIGSGVTEAACKTLIKQRFCKSGMRWKSDGMKIVLSLRQIVQSETRWDQFWEKINQYGVPAGM